MTGELMVAECAAIVPLSGVLVWYDYLNHRHLRLSSRGLELVGMFQHWRRAGDPQPADGARGPRADELQQLLEAGVLKVRGGPRDLSEQRVIADWGEDLLAARIFQFATRTSKAQQFVQADDAAEMLAERNLQQQRPRLCRQPNGQAYRLACGSALEFFGDSSLVSALLGRRSVRSFESARTVPQLAFSSVLQLGAGAREVQQAGRFDDSFKRTSPSGGALQPVDVYCYARRVEGIEAGWYYFDPVRFELARVAAAAADAEICIAAGDQRFFGAAAIMLLFVAEVRREFWKYRSSRAYRVVQADFGHLAQTFGLLAVEAGMASVVSCALRDELVESMLGLDGMHEVPLGAMALGYEDDSARLAVRQPGLVGGLGAADGVEQPAELALEAC